MTNELPKAAIRRIASDVTGASIGADFVDKLEGMTVAFIREQALKADKYAKHAGRKTLKAIDIQ